MHNNMKLSTKIILSFTFVFAISLISGLLLGHKLTSPISIVFFIIAFAFLIYTSFVVYQNLGKSIKKVISDLSETSSNLKLLSDDLTSTGHVLAEGSTEQAASIQETSSTLEESSSMVHQTTQNTKEADVLAKQTKQAADDGNIEMQTMLQTMEELKKSSDEIAKIIKVIDEIAFQTNILSLNAAVEAARAGDAGKGFAVVAEEVRNLAQRSATAAKDTAEIIESNISLSEKCLQITKKVGESLSGIKDDTHKVSELLDEISTASQEQEIGINQINQAISQMETVLQSNASTAQESATSADQLSSHSGDLQNITTELSRLLHGMDTVTSSSHKNSSSISSSSNRTLIPKIEKYKNTNTAVSKKAPVTHKEKTSKNNKEEKVVSKKAELKDEKVINPEDVIPLEDF